MRPPLTEEQIQRYADGLDIIALGSHEQYNIDIELLTDWNEEVQEFINQLMTTHDDLMQKMLSQCITTLESIGEQTFEIINTSKYDYVSLDIFTSFWLRCIVEYQIITNSSLPDFVENFFNFFMKDSSVFSKTDFSSEIHHLTYIFPSIVVKKLSTINNQSAIDNLLATQVAELNGLQETIEKYKTELGEIKHEYGFVQLNNAFNRMYMRKKTEHNNHLGVLILLTFIMISVPTVFLYLSYFKIHDFSYQEIISGVAITSLLIYFFRIVLHQFSSIREQILQLDNKQSLVEFIENYIDYKNGKPHGKDTLEKFDKIIFTQVLPNMENFPNSPDIVTILEKLAKVIKS